MFSRNIIDQIYSAIANSVMKYGDIKEVVYVNTHNIMDVRKSGIGIPSTFSIFFDSKKSKEFNMANIELALLEYFCKK